MLEKTLGMLVGLKPGTYVPDGTRCFDERELRELGSVLQRLLYAPSQIRRTLQTFGVNLVPANFYSEVPLLDDIERSFDSDRVGGFDYVFDDQVLAHHLRLLSEFGSEFVAPVDPVEGAAFHWTNSQFSYSDAMAYYCMVRLRQPATIVEIGSGFSTLVAAAAIRRNGRGRIICIEPYPRDFLGDVPEAQVISSRVQDVPVSFFNETLSDGDFLFIDSTHTVKHDSDCIYIYLRLLPRLAGNVVVHAHDIFFPRTFSLTQLRDEQIYWTEQYLLYAYLIDNRRTKVVFASCYNHGRHRDGLDAMMAGQYGSGGGSLWFEQAGVA